MPDEAKLSFAVITDPRGDTELLEKEILDLPKHEFKAGKKSLNKIKIDSLDAIFVVGDVVGPLLSEQESADLDRARRHFAFELERNRDRYAGLGVTDVAMLVDHLTHTSTFKRADEQQMYIPTFKRLVGYKGQNGTWTKFGEAKTTALERYRRITAIAESSKVPVYVAADTIFFEQAVPEKYWLHWKELTLGNKLIKALGTKLVDPQIPEYVVDPTQRGDKRFKLEEFDPLQAHILVTYRLPDDVHKQLKEKKGKIVIVGPRALSSDATKGTTELPLAKPDAIYPGNLFFIDTRNLTSFYALQGDDGVRVRHAWDLRKNHFARTSESTFNIAAAKTETALRSRASQAEAASQLLDMIDVMIGTMRYLENENPDLAQRMREAGYDKPKQIAIYMSWLEKQREGAFKERHDIAIRFTPFLEELVKLFDFTEWYTTEKNKVYEEKGVTQGGINTHDPDMEWYSRAIAKVKTEIIRVKRAADAHDVTMVELARKVKEFYKERISPELVNPEKVIAGALELAKSDLDEVTQIKDHLTKVVLPTVERQAGRLFDIDEIAKQLKGKDNRITATAAEHVIRDYCALLEQDQDAFEQQVKALTAVSETAQKTYEASLNRLQPQFDRWAKIEAIAQTFKEKYGERIAATELEEIILAAAELVAADLRAATDSTRVNTDLAKRVEELTAQTASLTSQLETRNRVVKEQAGLYEQQIKELQAARTSLDERYAAERAERAEKIRSLEDELSKKKTDAGVSGHKDEEISQLRQQHEAELIRLGQQHDGVVVQLRRDYDAKLAQRAVEDGKTLQKVYDARLAEEQRKFSDQLEVMRGQHQDNLAGKDRSIAALGAQHEAALAQLKQQHENNVGGIRREYDDKLAQSTRQHDEELQEQYALRLEEEQKKFNDQLEVLRKQHTSELAEKDTSIAELKQKYEGKPTDYDQKIAERDEKIEKLSKALTENEKKIRELTQARQADKNKGSNSKLEETLVELKANYSNAVALGMHAEALFEGDSKKAEKLYLRAHGIAPSAETKKAIAADIGRLYYHRGDHEKALEWFGKAPATSQTRKYAAACRKRLATSSQES